MGNCIIVVPCYNEASRLDAGAFLRFAAADHGQRFLMVNDGSTDNTLAVLKTLCKDNPEAFSLYDLPHNVGKAEAVRQGILRALQSSPETVGFWDADLATPLDAIPQFAGLLQDRRSLKMVVGARVKLLGRSVDRRPVRHYLGRVFATAASCVLRLPIYDTQCGAKLFRVDAETLALFEEPFMTNWVFDVELLARFICNRPSDAEAVGKVIYEFPLDCWHDVAGSKVRTRDFFKAFFELLSIYRTYFLRRRPCVVATPIDEDTSNPDQPRRRAA
jgi:dolichyl-phosphate beta-glucosyltransferase